MNEAQKAAAFLVTAEKAHTITALTARVEELEGALRFYADGSNWANPFGMSSILHDGGKVARAALSASQPAPSPWKPIETAPKDELIIVGPTKRMGICVAMNHSRDGWVTETCAEWVSMYTPTHWMPLPPAPQKEGE
jgi:hypothetical protein